MKSKERFKKGKNLSKTNEPLTQTFKTPDFMNKQYDISMVTEKGLFTMKDHSCTMLYQVLSSSASKTKLFEVLRSYDFEYRFFYYGIEEIYLKIWIKPDIQDLLVDIDKIEQDILPKLSRYGITLTAIPLDDRLRLVHKKICNYNNVTDNNVMNYINDVSAWKKDIGLYVDLSEKNTCDYRIKMAFIREFPQNNISDFVQCILSIEEIECVMIQYSPVKDEALRIFFNNTYMGCDNELRKLQTKNSTLYKILSKDTLSDTRTYCFMGMSILYSAQKKTVQKKIDVVMDKFSAQIGYYSSQPLEALFEFVPFGKWNYNQCRLFLNEDINNTMLLSDECNKKENDYERKENVFFI